MEIALRRFFVMVGGKRRVAGSSRPEMNAWGNGPCAAADFPLCNFSIFFTDLARSPLPLYGREYQGSGKNHRWSTRHSSYISLFHNRRFPIFSKISKFVQNRKCSSFLYILNVPTRTGGLFLILLSNPPSPNNCATSR